MSPSDSESEPLGSATVFRILDANLNRCLEGLRVVEEYLRFGLEDRHLAGACKQLRHDVVASVTQLDVSRLHAARDAAHDVGTRVSTAEEYERANLRSVAAAGWKRVEQALRSLEEYVKIVSPETAPVLESLRYRAYELERALTHLHRGHHRLASSYLYVLIDARASLEHFMQLARQLIEGGVDVLQLREKEMGDRELLERARALRLITGQHKVLFIMNDRADLAVLAGADGVHIGQTELTVKDARTVIGSDALIGVSTHCLTQARQAVLDGADYIGCGPTFRSATKQFQQLPGLDFLREVSREIHLPAFAIGGIRRDNIHQVQAAGFSRVAVCDGVLGARDPVTSARAMRTALVA